MIQLKNEDAKYKSGKFTKWHIAAIALVAAVVFGCTYLLTKSDTFHDKYHREAEKIIGKSQSAPYELLLVANKEWLKTTAGQALTVVLQQPIEGLPQPEEHFRITKVNPSDFSGTFHGYSNVIMIEIGPQYKEARTFYRKDVYCRPQTIMHIQAPNDETFYEHLKANAGEMFRTFDNNEIRREKALLERHYSGIVMKQVKKQFNVSLNAPEDIDEVKEGKNFMWASSPKNEYRLNMCVYRVPGREFTNESFCAVRDSVMKINIPGKRDDQWMETDIRTLSQGLSMGGESYFIHKMVGLWDMHHDALGGPFISYIIEDSSTHEWTVVEGFIIAPNEDKREMIRQLEAAIRTIEIPSLKLYTEL